MVCSINKLCYQYVNRVQPASYNIENSLYSPDDFEEEDNCAPPEDIGDHFVISLNIHLSNIFYYPITQKERSIMGNQPYVNANILDHLQDVFPYIPIRSLILEFTKNIQSRTLQANYWCSLHTTT